MLKLYKWMNEKKVELLVSKVMNSGPRSDGRIILDGITMCGKGEEYLRNIFIKQLEFINYKPYEQILEYNPYRFAKAWKSTTWQTSLLKHMPYGLLYHMLIGYGYGDYKDENGLLDMKRLEHDRDTLEFTNSEFKNIEELYLSVARKKILKESKVTPNLKINNQLLKLYPHAKTIYVCDDTKIILVSFEFREILMDSSAAKIRLDSWKHNPRYYIEDQDVLQKQLKKFEKFKKENNAPESNDPVEFLNWCNSDSGTVEACVTFIYFSHTLRVGSFQYYKECQARFKQNNLYDKYADYEIYSSESTFDPVAKTCYCQVFLMDTVAHDYDSDPRYIKQYMTDVYVPDFSTNPLFK